MSPITKSFFHLLKLKIMKRKQYKGRKFRQTICCCGCKAIYWKWLNPPKPMTYKVIKYQKYSTSASVHDGISFELPDAIEREDGVIFEVGDLIQTITPMGEKYSQCIIISFQIEPCGFMQIHCQPVGRRAGVSIRNGAMWMTNGDDPNIFCLIENITKI